MINAQKISMARRPGWLAVMIVSLVLTTLAMVLSVGSAYSVWRDFKSVGAQKFITTGNVTMKEVSEKTGRRSYRTVNKYFAVFQSEDGRYQHNAEITSTQRSRIQRGSRYSRMYEVFIDRNGSYKVVAMKDAAKQKENNGWSNAIVFFIVALAGATGARFSFRQWRPKPPPGIISR